MSEATIIAITSGTTLATLILSRIRCLFRPCDPGGQYCQSGCTDQKLDKDEGHEIKIFGEDNVFKRIKLAMSEEEIKAEE